MRSLLAILGLIQAVLALRVAARWARTARGTVIARRDDAATDERVSVLLPVLNEERRLEPCLASLVAQGSEVAEIVVIDGGSTDRTVDLVRRFAERDSRVRLVSAAPVPPTVNGKAYGLAKGIQCARPDTAWILTIDADVRVDSALTRSLLAHAERERVDALSVATRQALSGPVEGLLHPAMLTTLVYRLGIPGTATTDLSRVQANGQCFLVQRDALCAVGGFDSVMDSICEDFTLARAIATAGHRVGFYESDNLAWTEMYASWREAWENWTRSLPLRDRYTQGRTFVGLAEVTLVQALPLWLLPVLTRRLGRRHPLTRLNVALAASRLGVLAGTARAYPARPLTYWLSPLCDLPVAARLWWMATRRQHRWRGRIISRGDSRP